MRVIKIYKCFDDCPHCTGPDYNPGSDRWQYTCQEVVEWIDNEDIIAEFCPLEECDKPKGAPND